MPKRLLTRTNPPLVLRSPAHTTHLFEFCHCENSPFFLSPRQPSASLLIGRMSPCVVQTGLSESFTTTLVPNPAATSLRSCFSLRVSCSTRGPLRLGDAISLPLWLLKLCLQCASLLRSKPIGTSSPLRRRTCISDTLRRSTAPTSFCISDTVPTHPVTVKAQRPPWARLPACPSARPSANPACASTKLHCESCNFSLCPGWRQPEPRAPQLAATVT